MTTRREQKQQLIAGVVCIIVLATISAWLYISRLQEQLLDAKDQLRTAEIEAFSRREEMLHLATILAKEKAADHITAAVVLTTHRAVDPELAEIIVREAVKQGEERQIHPLLILGLIKVESRFDPMAVSRAGAIGLMQIMKEHHPEKIADEDLFHIGVNIRVGCHILAEYLKACNNNLPLALHRYLGRKAKGKELATYQLAVLKTFFELVTAHETLRQNYLNN